MQTRSSVQVYQDSGGGGFRMRSALTYKLLIGFLSLTTLTTIGLGISTGVLSYQNGAIKERFKDQSLSLKECQVSCQKCECSGGGDQPEPEPTPIPNVKCSNMYKISYDPQIGGVDPIQKIIQFGIANYTNTDLGIPKEQLPIIEEVCTDPDDVCEYEDQVDNTIIVNSIGQLSVTGEEQWGMEFQVSNSENVVQPPFAIQTSSILGNIDLYGNIDGAIKITESVESISVKSVTGLEGVGISVSENVNAPVVIGGALNSLQVSGSVGYDESETAIQVGGSVLGNIDFLGGVTGNVQLKDGLEGNIVSSVIDGAISTTGSVGSIKVGSVSGLGGVGISVTNNVNAPIEINGSVGQNIEQTAIKVGSVIGNIVSSGNIDGTIQTTGSVESISVGSISGSDEGLGITVNGDVDGTLTIGGSVKQTLTIQESLHQLQVSGSVGYDADETAIYVGEAVIGDVNFLKAITGNIQLDEGLNGNIVSSGSIVGNIQATGSVGSVSVGSVSGLGGVGISVTNNVIGPIEINGSVGQISGQTAIKVGGTIIGNVDFLKDTNGNIQLKDGLNGNIVSSGSVDGSITIGGSVGTEQSETAIQVGSVTGNVHLDGDLNGNIEISSGNINGGITLDGSNAAITGAITTYGPIGSVQANSITGIDNISISVGQNVSGTVTIGGSVEGDITVQGVINGSLTTGGIVDRLTITGYELDATPTATQGPISITGNVRQLLTITGSLHQLQVSGSVGYSPEQTAIQVGSVIGNIVSSGNIDGAISTTGSIGSVSAGSITGIEGITVNGDVNGSVTLSGKVKGDVKIEEAITGSLTTNGVSNGLTINDDIQGNITVGRITGSLTTDYIEGGITIKGYTLENGSTIATSGPISITGDVNYPIGITGDVSEPITITGDVSKPLTIDGELQQLVVSGSVGSETQETAIQVGSIIGNFELGSGISTTFAQEDSEITPKQAGNPVIKGSLNINGDIQCPKGACVNIQGDISATNGAGVYVKGDITPSSGNVGVQVDGSVNGDVQVGDSIETLAAKNISAVKITYNEPLSNDDIANVIGQIALYEQENNEQPTLTIGAITNEPSISGLMNGNVQITKITNDSIGKIIVSNVQHTQGEEESTVIGQIQFFSPSETITPSLSIEQINDSLDIEKIKTSGNISTLDVGKIENTTSDNMVLSPPPKTLTLIFDGTSTMDSIKIQDTNKVDKLSIYTIDNSFNINSLMTSSSINTVNIANVVDNMEVKQIEETLTITNNVNTIEFTTEEQTTLVQNIKVYDTIQLKPMTILTGGLNNQGEAGNLTLRDITNLTTEGTITNITVEGTGSLANVSLVGSATIGTVNIEVPASLSTESTAVINNISLYPTGKSYNESQLNIEGVYNDLTISKINAYDVSSVSAQNSIQALTAKSVETVKITYDTPAQNESPINVVGSFELYEQGNESVKLTIGPITNEPSISGLTNGNVQINTITDDSIGEIIISNVQHTSEEPESTVIGQIQFFPPLETTNPSLSIEQINDTFDIAKIKTLGEISTLEAEKIENTTSDNMVLSPPPKTLTLVFNNTSTMDSVRIQDFENVTKFTISNIDNTININSLIANTVGNLTLMGDVANITTQGTITNLTVDGTASLANVSLVGSATIGTVNIEVPTTLQDEPTAVISNISLYPSGSTYNDSQLNIEGVYNNNSISKINAEGSIGTANVVDFDTITAKAINVINLNQTLQEDGSVNDEIVILGGINYPSGTSIIGSINGNGDISSVTGNSIGTITASTIGSTDASTSTALNVAQGITGSVSLGNIVCGNESSLMTSNCVSIGDITNYGENTNAINVGGSVNGDIYVKDSIKSLAAKSIESVKITYDTPVENEESIDVIGSIELYEENIESAKLTIGPITNEPSITSITVGNVYINETKSDFVSDIIISNVKNTQNPEQVVINSIQLKEPNVEQAALYIGEINSSFDIATIRTPKTISILDAGTIENASSTSMILSPPPQTLTLVFNDTSSMDSVRIQDSKNVTKFTVSNIDSSFNITSISTSSNINNVDLTGSVSKLTANSVTELTATSVNVLTAGSIGSADASTSAALKVTTGITGSVSLGNVACGSETNKITSVCVSAGNIVSYSTPDTNGPHPSLKVGDITSYGGYGAEMNKISGDGDGIVVGSVEVGGNGVQVDKVKSQMGVTIGQSINTNDYAINVEGTITCGNSSTSTTANSCIQIGNVEAYMNTDVNPETEEQPPSVIYIGNIKAANSQALNVSSINCGEKSTSNITDNCVQIGDVVAYIDSENVGVQPAIIINDIAANNGDAILINDITADYAGVTITYGVNVEEGPGIKVNNINVANSTGQNAIQVIESITSKSSNYAAVDIVGGIVSNNGQALNVDDITCGTLTSSVTNNCISIGDVIANISDSSKSAISIGSASTYETGKTIVVSGTLINKAGGSTIEVNGGNETTPSIVGNIKVSNDIQGSVSLENIVATSYALSVNDITCGNETNKLENNCVSMNNISNYGKTDTSAIYVNSISSNDNSSGIYVQTNVITENNGYGVYIKGDLTGYGGINVDGSLTATGTSAIKLNSDITCGSVESPIEGNCIYVGTSVNGDIYVEDSIQTIVAESIDTIKLTYDTPGEEAANVIGKIEIYEENIESAKLTIGPITNEPSIDSLNVGDVQISNIQNNFISDIVITNVATPASETDAINVVNSINLYRNDGENNILSIEGITNEPLITSLTVGDVYINNTKSNFVSDVIISNVNNLQDPEQIIINSIQLKQPNAEQASLYIGEINSSFDIDTIRTARTINTLDAGTIEDASSTSMILSPPPQTLTLVFNETSTMNSIKIQDKDKADKFVITEINESFNINSISASSNINIIGITGNIGELTAASIGSADASTSTALTVTSGITGGVSLGSVTCGNSSSPIESNCVSMGDITNYGAENTNAIHINSVSSKNLNNNGIYVVGNVESHTNGVYVGGVISTYEDAVQIKGSVTATNSDAITINGLVESKNGNGITVGQSILSSASAVYINGSITANSDSAIFVKNSVIGDNNGINIGGDLTTTSGTAINIGGDLTTTSGTAINVGVIACGDENNTISSNCVSIGDVVANMSTDSGVLSAINIGDISTTNGSAILINDVTADYAGVEITYGVSVEEGPGIKVSTINVVNSTGQNAISVTESISSQSTNYATVNIAGGIVSNNGQALNMGAITCGTSTSPIEVNCVQMNNVNAYLNVPENPLAAIKLTDITVNDGDGIQINSVNAMRSAISVASTLTSEQENVIEVAGNIEATGASNDAINVLGNIILDTGRGLYVDGTIQGSVSQNVIYVKGGSETQYGVTGGITITNGVNGQVDLGNIANGQVSLGNIVCGSAESPITSNCVSIGDVVANMDAEQAEVIPAITIGNVTANDGNAILINNITADYAGVVIPNSVNVEQGPGIEVTNVKVNSQAGYSAIHVNKSIGSNATNYAAVDIENGIVSNKGQAIDVGGVIGCGNAETSISQNCIQINDITHYGAENTNATYINAINSNNNAISIRSNVRSSSGTAINVDGKVIANNGVGISTNNIQADVAGITTQDIKTSGPSFVVRNIESTDIDAPAIRISGNLTSQNTDVEGALFIQGNISAAGRAISIGGYRGENSNIFTKAGEALYVSGNIEANSDVFATYPDVIYIEGSIKHLSTSSGEVIHVGGDITTNSNSGQGVYVEGSISTSYSCLRVKGSMTATGAYAVNVDNDLTGTGGLYVGGSINATSMNGINVNQGITSSSDSIKVGDTLKSTNGNGITVNGTFTSKEAGVYVNGTLESSNNNGITVNGTLTSKAVGVYVNGTLTSTNGNGITVDGIITANAIGVLVDGDITSSVGSAAVNISGDITAGGKGVYVGGNISSTNGNGISVGGNITATGDISSSIYADGVYVGGNISSDTGNGISVSGNISAYGGGISVTNNVTSINADAIFIGGNISVNGSANGIYVARSINTTNGAGVKVLEDINSPNVDCIVIVGNLISSSANGITVSQDIQAGYSGIQVSGNITASGDVGISVIGGITTSNADSISIGGNISSTNGNGISIGGNISSTNGNGISIGGNVSASEVSGTPSLINAIYVSGNVSSSDVGIYVGRSINTTDGSGIVVMSDINSVKMDCIYVMGNLISSTGKGITVSQGIQAKSGISVGGNLRASNGAGVNIVGNINTTGGNGITVGGNVVSTNTDSGINVNGNIIVQSNKPDMRELYGFKVNQIVCNYGTNVIGTGSAIYVGSTIQNNGGNVIHVMGTIEATGGRPIIFEEDIIAHNGRTVEFNGRLVTYVGEPAVRFNGDIQSSHGNGIEFNNASIYVDSSSSNVAVYAHGGGVWNKGLLIKDSSGSIKLLNISSINMDTKTFGDITISGSSATDQCIISDILIQLAVIDEIKTQVTQVNTGANIALKYKNETKRLAFP